MMVRSLVSTSWDSAVVKSSCCGSVCEKDCQDCGCQLVNANGSTRYCAECKHKRGLARQHAYQQTQAYRDSLAKYRASEKYRRVSHEYQEKYQQSEEIREERRIRAREMAEKMRPFKLCRQCGEVQILYPSRRLYCAACRIQRYRNWYSQYCKTSVEFKASQQRYRNSANGKVTRAAYAKSDARQVVVAKYRASEKGQAAREKRNQQRRKGIMEEIRTNVTLERAV